MTTLEERSTASRNGPASVKDRLVVIGNGMAGVRAVEEIMSRGGAETFAVTVFGDEPYGNYNRILLSNVLAGSDDTAEIYPSTRSTGTPTTTSTCAPGSGS